MIMFDNSFRGTIPVIHKTYDYFMVHGNRLSCKIHSTADDPNKAISIYDHLILIRNDFDFMEPNPHLDEKERSPSLMVPRIHTWFPQFFFIFVWLCTFHWLKAEYKRKKTSPAFNEEYQPQDQRRFLVNHKLVLRFGKLF
eukprot:UN33217